MFSILKRMTLASIAALAIGAGGATVAPSTPAFAEHAALYWWELGVTPSYGYGDDYPQRPRVVKERFVAPASRHRLPERH